MMTFAYIQQMPDDDLLEAQRSPFVSDHIKMMINVERRRRHVSAAIREIAIEREDRESAEAERAHNRMLALVWSE